MRMTQIVAIAIAVLSVALPVGSQMRPGLTTAPQIPVRVRRIYTLQRCLKLAERNYPKVHEALAQLENKRAQAWEARTAPFSDFRMDAWAGPAPTVRGTNVYSPDTDVALSKNMGLAWQIGIEGAVPLWTFGKLTHLWTAADAQVRVGENEVKKARNEVRLNVHKAFYGLQLARDALALMRDAGRQMGKYASRLERRVAQGEGDDIELLKIRMYSAELEAKESEVRQEERAGLGALRFLHSRIILLSLLDV